MDEIEALAEVYNLKGKYSSFFRKSHGPIHIDYSRCFDKNGELKQ